jgi:hypothetical protein
MLVDSEVSACDPPALGAGNVACAGTRRAEPMFVSRITGRGTTFEEMRRGGISGRLPFFQTLTDGRHDGFGVEEVTAQGSV